MPVYDCLCNYIQFATKSDAKTKLWTRDDIPHDEIYYKKLKYYILKNPPSTVKNTPQLIVCKNVKTVRVGNKQFVINSNIFDRVEQKLAQNPTNSSDVLKQYIAEARSELGITPPLSVQNKDIPLRNVLINKTYNSLGTKWETSKILDKPRVGSLFKFGKKVSSLFETYKETLPYINFWSGKFRSRNLNLKQAQYFYAQENDGCNYTSSYVDLYGKALRSGASILPISALLLYQETGIINFEPFPSSSRTLSLMLAFVISDQNFVKLGVFPAKFGAIFVASTYWLDSVPKTPVNGTNLQTLLRNEIKANSELIFIPILSELDIIENVTISPNTGASFPATNGGDITVNIGLLQLQLKNQFADSLTVQNQDYSFVVQV